MTELHAVRWAQRYDRMRSVVWTKWHIANEDGFTLCGHPVIVAPDHCPEWPETDENVSRATCQHCIKKSSYPAPPEA
jgi:hypothetical protein